MAAHLQIFSTNPWENILMEKILKEMPRHEETCLPQWYVQKRSQVSEKNCLGKHNSTAVQGLDQILQWPFYTSVILVLLLWGIRPLAPPVSQFTIPYALNSPHCCMISLCRLDAHTLTPQILQVETYYVSRINCSITNEGGHLCLGAKRHKSVCTHPGGQTQPETQGRCAEKVRFNSWFSQVLSLLSSGSTCGLLQLI